jgi:glycoside/pentoside/hexuronide:cation symporter, GPH family
MDDQIIITEGNNSGKATVIGNGKGVSTRRLSVWEKVGYSAGDAASNLYFQIFVVFLPIFYTDVFGLPAAAMGTMFLIARIWDAVNDPVMGIIADRTNSRWGKFRPYIFIMAIPLALGGVLAFTTPNFGTGGMLLFAYVTYILLMMLYTAVNVPYSALMGVMTPNSMERTEVSSFRFVAAFIGQAIVGAATLTLVSYFGRGNEQTGWQMTIGLYGLLAVLLLMITFFSTRERVMPLREQKTDIRNDLKDLVKNRPWVLIAFATLFQLTYIVMRGSSTPYYFRYYVMDQQFVFFNNTINLSYALFTSSFVTVGTIATLVGAILTKWFSTTIDKKNIYSGFLIASALFSCLFFFIQPHNIMPMFILNILVSFFFGSVSVLQWAIYTDAADYGEWKFGRRATGLVMAASLFALKLGLTFGGAIVGWTLEAFGFRPLVEQPAETLLGIRLLMSVFPAVFGIIGGSIMLFYPLSNLKMVGMERDLASRRG